MTLQNLLSLNPKVKRHASVVPSVLTKVGKKHWKRNKDKSCSVCLRTSAHTHVYIYINWCVCIYIYICRWCKNIHKYHKSIYIFILQLCYSVSYVIISVSSYFMAVAYYPLIYIDIFCRFLSHFSVFGTFV